MIHRTSDKPLAVISYETQTLFFLRTFLSQESDETVTRIDPEKFLLDPSDQYQYINLVVKDFDLRKRISQTLDQHQLGRWTFIGEDAKEIRHTTEKNEHLSIGDGCFIYPAVWVYSGAIGNDVIIHGMVRIAENVKIGNGTFISGSVTIAGSCNIGSWCFIGNNIFFIDSVDICDDVKLLPGTNIRKSITSPGVYYNPYTYKIEKILV